ncbi:MAG: DNA repair protein RecN [Actinobacteria bacterium]|nr:DNA repair protein RecN [Actinomycetota bacterium]NBY15807.1 DNA repair protein RecN [Actinomycetota bacterium]
MLEILRIRNLGVIADAELNFSPGFTALTGETGAGKTMVFRSIAMLFGAKPDASLIADGADAAAVMAELAVPADIKVRLLELGATVEDDVVIVGRQVPLEGRTRSVIGGTAMPNTTLVDLGGEMIAVHGQSDHMKLRKPAHQRLILDRFGGVKISDVLTRYQDLWAQHLDLQHRIDSLSADSASRQLELDRITSVITRFDELQPQPAEDETLATEALRLGNSESLFVAAMQAGEAIGGSDYDGEFVAGLLTNARKALEQSADLDEQLEGFATRVRELEVLAGELASELTQYASAIDASPQRLAYIEQRRSELKQLAREFGTVDDLIAWVEVNRPRMELLQGGDEHVSELKMELAACTAQMLVLAGDISKQRHLAATAFEQAVRSELEGLAMSGASVSFQIRPTDLGPFGADDIELGLVSRPNAPWVPISRGASGGELSRLMLAVQVVLASADPIDTFIFDEVDAGVGGAAAVEVGRRLARLARSSQVIVVTHLPQVAAFADKHYVVQANQGQQVHASQIREVSGEDRVTEISRMLAGLSDSSAGADLALELLELAASESHSN